MRLFPRDFAGVVTDRDIREQEWQRDSADEREREMERRQKLGYINDSGQMLIVEVCKATTEHEENRETECLFKYYLSSTVLNTCTWTPK